MAFSHRSAVTKRFFSSLAVLFFVISLAILTAPFDHSPPKLPFEISSLQRRDGDIKNTAEVLEYTFPTDHRLHKRLDQDKIEKGRVLHRVSIVIPSVGLGAGGNSTYSKLTQKPTQASKEGPCLDIWRVICLLDIQEKVQWLPKNLSVHGSRSTGDKYTEHSSVSQRYRTSNPNAEANGRGGLRVAGPIAMPDTRSGEGATDSADFLDKDECCVTAFGATRFPAPWLAAIPDKHSNDHGYDAEEAKHEEVMQLIRFDEEEQNEAAKVDDRTHEVGCGNVGAVGN
ncbi:uncharacterized protein PAC_18350 [Phialocephala subalpina]|uniref:Uncharacterized protein n=1 Tax=Phialocephala subalpina TaxID=576137 RepID=A0A1L7XTS8_9HELO|nr:uncharacterized protein PAC_18350 [Phialocephala subalpina]